MQPRNGVRVSGVKRIDNFFCLRKIAGDHRRRPENPCSAPSRPTPRPSQLPRPADGLLSRHAPLQPGRQPLDLLADHRRDVHHQQRIRNLDQHRDRSEHDEPRNELPQRHRVPAGVRDRPAHRPERRRHASGRTFGHLMERYDVLLTPTLAMLPLPPAEPATVDDAQSLSEVIDRSHRFSPSTAWFIATGQPAMSVPLYWDKRGCPSAVISQVRSPQSRCCFRLRRNSRGLRPGPIEDHRSPLAVRHRELSEGRSTAPASRRMPALRHDPSHTSRQSICGYLDKPIPAFTGETGYCMTGVPRAVHRARILRGAYAPPSR
ncbi:protein of unknown function [Paraburkholderia kururiensis]